MHKHRFNTFILIYISLISIFNVYLWLTQYTGGPRNHKILIAIVLTAAAVLFTDKISDDKNIAPAIKLFGLLGATAICIAMY